MQKPADSLTEEFAALSQLQSLLQQEQTVLTAGQADALPEVIVAKGNLISDIAKLADARHQRLVGAGFEASENSMQSWIDRHGAAADKQQWSDLLQMAHGVKEQNRLNGLLINKQMQVNQQTLNIFANQLGNGSFYGPNGQSSGRTSARKFGAV
jgi:flagella synthesis protein FlgN